MPQSRARRGSGLFSSAGDIVRARADENPDGRGGTPALLSLRTLPVGVNVPTQEKVYGCPKDDVLRKLKFCQLVNTAQHWCVFHVRPDSGVGAAEQRVSGRRLLT